MCRGYHRQEIERSRRLRLVLAEVRNGLRGPGEEWQPATALFSLPGDEATGGGHILTPEEIEAEFARVSELDKDLL